MGSKLTGFEGHTKKGRESSMPEKALFSRPVTAHLGRSNEVMGEQLIRCCHATSGAETSRCGLYKQRHFSGFGVFLMLKQ